MRGIHYGTTINDSAVRFTPAHAGNTNNRADPEGTGKVHPRPRREYSQTVPDKTAQPGSPPPMRGIRFLYLLNRQPFRFTPAHAGNTELRHGDNMGTQVHPRPCGEYLVSYIHKAFRMGSSPLTRGIRIRKTMIFT